MASSSFPYSVDVCPNAKWRDLIFLRGPVADGTFDNVNHWESKEVEDYAKKTIVPQVQPNIAFIALALLSLVIFLLWRLMRRCCMCCCMRQSCEEKRAAADPKEILSGWGYWVSKILALVVALAALCMMIAGIAVAQPELVVRVWRPIDRFTFYLNNMTDAMHGLVDGLDGVNPIMDNLTSIANNDINFAYLRVQLGGIESFLDSPATDAAAIDASLRALDTSVTSMRADLSSASSSLASLRPTFATFTLGVGYLGSATTTFAGYSSDLATLSNQLVLLTSAAGPTYSTTNLEAAMNAVDLDTWRPRVAAMSGALDAWTSWQAPASTLSGLANTLEALNASLVGLQSRQVPAARDSITAFFGAWTSSRPYFANLLAQIDSIQANVVALDAGTNASLQRLRSILTDVDALTARSPTPAALAANLAALMPDLALPPSTPTLIANLRQAQTALDGASTTALTGAKSAIDALKTKLDALASPKAATQTALDTYKADNTNQAKFDALKGSVDGTSGNTASVTAEAQTAANTAATSPDVAVVQLAVGTTGLAAKASAIDGGLGTQASGVGDVSTSLDSRVPALGPYTTLTGAVKTVYAALPSPKSAEVRSVKGALNDVEEQMLSVPAEVKAQVADVQHSFGDGIDKLHDEVIDKLNDFQDDHTEDVKKVDKIRYQATAVLFGVGAAIAVFMLLFLAINCPWGIGCTIFLSLVLAVLLFLLAAVFAAVLALAQDGCYHAENTALVLVSDNTGNSSNNSNSSASGGVVTPLLRYYFFGSNNESVAAVLKQADLVDIDKVTGDVTDQSNSIIADLTATYQPRPKLRAVLDGVLGFVNATLGQVDAILALASVAEVRPLYVAVKGFPCCDIADFLGRAWVVCTFGGWLLMTAASLAMGHLGRLDRIALSGCCGCKPLLGGRLSSKQTSGQVYPDGPGGEKGQAAPPQQAMMVVSAYDPYSGQPAQPYPYPSAPAYPAVPQ